MPEKGVKDQLEAWTTIPVVDPLSPHSTLFVSSSFRDRLGRVFQFRKQVYRALAAAAYEDWQVLSKAPFFQEEVKKGRIVPTQEVDSENWPAELNQQGWVACLEHERIPTISYPYEWSFGMLRDAALLQLELLQKALLAGLTLKDGTSYNVQFRGCEPVFIDIPSFQIRQEGEGWLGYRQFCQLNLYPLLLEAYRGIPFQPWLRGSLEGIEPQWMRSQVTWWDLLFRKGVWSHVVLHAMLDQQSRQQGNTELFKVKLCGLVHGSGMSRRSQWSRAEFHRQKQPVSRDRAAWYPP